MLKLNEKQFFNKTDLEYIKQMNRFAEEINKKAEAKRLYKLFGPRCVQSKIS